jgi:hypothetical protein
MDNFKSFTATIDGEETVILRSFAPEIAPPIKPASELAAWVDSMITRLEMVYITDSIAAWDKAFKKRQIVQLSWDSFKTHVLVTSIRKLDGGRFEVRTTIH